MSIYFPDEIQTGPGEDISELDFSEEARRREWEEEIAFLDDDYIGLDPDELDLIAEIAIAEELMGEV